MADVAYNVGKVALYAFMFSYLHILRSQKPYDAENETDTLGLKAWNSMESKCARQKIAQPSQNI